MALEGPRKPTDAIKPTAPSTPTGEVKQTLLERIFNFILKILKGK